MKTKSINYNSLESLLPISSHAIVMSQTVIINRKNWGCSSRTIFFNNLDEKVQNLICKFLRVSERIEISRSDIFKTDDIGSKIIKALMWGYPRGTTNRAVGNNNGIHVILTRLHDCCNHLKEIKDCDYKSADDFLEDEHVSFLFDLRGVGVSTLSKLLYFFNVKIEGKQCVIFDSRVYKALSRFEETCNLSLRQYKIKDYPIFVRRIGEISENLDVSSDVIEYILFNS